MIWKHRISRLGLVLFLMVGILVIPQVTYAEPDDSIDCTSLDFFSHFTTCLQKGYNWVTFGGITDPIRGLYGRTKETITGNSYNEELIQKHQANQKQDEVETDGKTLIDFLAASITTVKKVGSIVLVYNQYPLAHYMLDLHLQEVAFWNLDERVLQSVYHTLHVCTNVIWLLMVFFARLVVWMVEAALQTDLVGDFAEVIGEGMRTFAGLDGTVLTNGGVWGLFLPIMVVLLGSWIGWKAVAEGDSEGAQRGLIHSVMVLFLSFTFIYYAGDIAKKANEISSGVTVGMMSVAINALQPNQSSLTPEETVAQAGNSLWQILVYKPYLLMQYGTTQVKPERVEPLLKVNPLTSQRALVVEKEVTQHNNINMTPKNSVIRMMFLPLLMIVNLVVSLMVVLLTGSFLLYQLYFMIVFLLAPLALIWAVVPAWQDSAYRWLSEVLGALLMKLGIGVFLAMYFSFSAALYDYSESHYLLTVLLQMILVVMMILQSRRIFSYVLMPAHALGGQMGHHSRASRYFLRYTHNERGTCCCCDDGKNDSENTGGISGVEPPEVGGNQEKWGHPEGDLPFPDEEKDDRETISIPLLLSDSDESDSMETKDSKSGGKGDRSGGMIPIEPESKIPSLLPNDDD